MSHVREGGCMCGAVRYRVEGPMRPIVMCHCEQCRRMTGHFLAATAARRRDFHLTGEDALAWYSASPAARRGFCRHCGSTLFWEAVGRDTLSIAAGSLDDARGLAVDCHIFAGERGAYYRIEDGARVFEGDATIEWHPAGDAA